MRRLRPVRWLLVCLLFSDGGKQAAQCPPRRRSAFGGKRVGQATASRRSEVDLTDEVLVKLLGVSHNLLRDEAEAVGARLDDDEDLLLSSLGVPRSLSQSELLNAQLLDCDAEELMGVLLDPIATVSAAEGEACSVTAMPKDEPLATIGGTAAAEDLIALLQLGSTPSESLSPAVQAAVELLLQGLDVKALLPTGVLRDLQLRGKYLSRCDFSTVRFTHMEAEGCDFSRSLFYQSSFQHCTFTRCCFDGCVFKRTRCMGEVRFVDCSFRFASLALHADAAVRFERCDFDLSDFEGSSGLNRPQCYVECINQRTAAQFPLRASQRAAGR